MPPRSQAQRRLMHAACKGKTKKKVPRKVACEYARSDPGGRLPARAKPKKKRR